MKKSCLLLLLFSLAGCLDMDSPVNPAKLVEIDLLEIEPTGQLNEDILVRVRTKAYNGCWSDLQVMLTKEDSRHVRLTAFGTFEEADVCTENLVREDTVIKFMPTRAGEYYFQANFEPFPVLRDTVEVN